MYEELKSSLPDGIELVLFDVEKIRSYTYKIYLRIYRSNKCILKLDVTNYPVSYQMGDVPCNQIYHIGERKFLIYWNVNDVNFNGDYLQLLDLNNFSDTNDFINISKENFDIIHHEKNKFMVEINNSKSTFKINDNKIVSSINLLDNDFHINESPIGLLANINDYHIKYKHNTNYYTINNQIIKCNNSLEIHYRNNKLFITYNDSNIHICIIDKDIKFFNINKIVDFVLDINDHGLVVIHNGILYFLTYDNKEIELGKTDPLSNICMISHIADMKNIVNYIPILDVLKNIILLYLM